jgi:hypothetical protein
VPRIIAHLATEILRVPNILPQVFSFYTYARQQTINSKNVRELTAKTQSAQRLEVKEKIGNFRPESE